MRDKLNQYLRNDPLADPNQCWVTWEYQEDEWNRFNRAEDKRAGHEARRRLIIMLIVALAVGIIGTIIGLSSGANFGLLFGGFIAAYGLLSYGLDIFTSMNLRRAREKGPRRICVAPARIQIANACITLIDWRTSLLWISVAPNDPHLLRFSTAVGAGRTSSNIEVRIPIPPGKEAEAAQLIERFKHDIFRADSSPKRNKV